MKEMEGREISEKSVMEGRVSGDTLMEGSGGRDV